MTTEISWDGTLTDENKIKDLTSFITRLGYMVHRIYFAETPDNVSIRQFNGYYTGNIALSKAFVTNGDFSALNADQVIESKSRYKIQLENRLTHLAAF